MFAQFTPPLPPGDTNTGVSQDLQSGIERGTLRPDTDPVIAHELLIGPVYYRLLLSGAPLDQGLGTRIVSAVFPAIAALH